MAYSYRPVDRSQPFLLPPDIRDWLPEGHLVWFVLDVVARLDTSALHARHPNDGVGRRAYDPDMLLALLVYAYCQGVRSSRAIERLCEMNVAYRVICANDRPDHTTIARFRQAHQVIAQQLFVDVLAICAAAGLATVGVVAVDGTKMAGDASLKANRTRAHIEVEVADMFAQAEAHDAEEGRLFGEARGDELPEELSDPRRRSARLDHALAVLDAEEAARLQEAEAARAATAGSDGDQDGPAKGGRPRHDDEIAIAEAELARVEAELARPDSALARAEAKVAAATEEAAAAEATRTASGKKRGRPRQSIGGSRVARVVARRDRQAALAERRRRHAQARVAKARARTALRAAQHAAERQAATVNVTDPDSRIMKTPRGWVQGYNAQASANTAGIILAAEVTQDHNDVHQCTPMIAATAANLAAAGVDQPVGIMLFDAGYLSDNNLTSDGPDRLIATAKSWKLRRQAKRDGYAHGDAPPGSSLVDAMEHRLKTEEGSRLYGLRQHTIEPIFGHNKFNRGFDRFMRRGRAAADAEWKLIAATHNLLKLHTHTQTTLAT